MLGSDAALAYAGTSGAGVAGAGTGALDGAVAGTGVATVEERAHAPSVARAMTRRADWGRIGPKLRRGEHNGRPKGPAGASQLRTREEWRGRTVHSSLLSGPMHRNATRQRSGRLAFVMRPERERLLGAVLRQRLLKHLCIGNVYGIERTNVYTE